MNLRKRASQFDQTVRESSEGTNENSLGREKGCRLALNDVFTKVNNETLDSTMGQETFHNANNVERNEFLKTGNSDCKNRVGNNDQTMFVGTNSDMDDDLSDDVKRILTKFGRCFPTVKSSDRKVVSLRDEISQELNRIYSETENDEIRSTNEPNAAQSNNESAVQADGRWISEIEMSCESVKADGRKMSDIETSSEASEDALAKRVQELLLDAKNAPEFQVLSRETSHLSSVGSSLRSSVDYGLLQRDLDSIQDDLVMLRRSSKQSIVDQESIPCVSKESVDSEANVLSDLNSSSGISSDRSNVPGCSSNLKSSHDHSRSRYEEVLSVRQSENLFESSFSGRNGENNKRVNDFTRKKEEFNDYLEKSKSTLGRNSDLMGDESFSSGNRNSSVRLSQEFMKGNLNSSISFNITTRRGSGLDSYHDVNISSRENVEANITKRRGSDMSIRNSGQMLTKERVSEVGGNKENRSGLSDSFVTQKINVNREYQPTEQLRETFEIQEKDQISENQSFDELRGQKAVRLSNTGGEGGKNFRPTIPCRGTERAFVKESPYGDELMDQRYACDGDDNVDVLGKRSDGSAKENVEGPDVPPFNTDNGFVDGRFR